MGIRETRQVVLAGLLAVLVAGCKTPTDEADSAGAEGQMPEPTQVETTRSVPEAPPEPIRAVPTIRGGGDGERPSLLYPLRDGSSELGALSGIFYFDFDQAIVKRAGHDELNKHAAYLRSTRSAQVRLEGHADERGTREYNLALGERRANAVRGYLVRQGASSSQIEVISYGEEKPVRGGQDERSYALNRRVEINYR